MKPIPSGDLVAMDVFFGHFPIGIDLVYARADHPENIFGTALYASTARLWLHKDMAAVTLLASRLLTQRHGWKLILKDGLRPVEAQAAMGETDLVKANPHWLQEPRLLSPPGGGGHPRGMAVDVTVEDTSGSAVDMGTVFDHLSEDPSENPARRDYEDLPQAVLDARAALEAGFRDAAARLDLPLWPLPQEWWDFRFTREYSNQFAPIHDADLPAGMHVVAQDAPGVVFDVSATEKAVLKQLCGIKTSHL